MPRPGMKVAELLGRYPELTPGPEVLEALGSRASSAGGRGSSRRAASA